VVVAAVVVAVPNGFATNARQQIVAPKLHAEVAINFVGDAFGVER
jgi:hypothetical protein